MSILNSGLVGNIGLDHMKAVRKETQEKWESIGFLDGLKGHIRENVAILFENQATSLLKETTTATNSGSFETVVFPIVRRVFSKLLANDLVSVQAMNLPIGKLFYFIPQTSSRVDGAGVAGNDYTTTSSSDVYGTTYSAHTSFASTGIPSCVNTANCAITQMQAKNLYDAFYNDGLFDNSKGTLTIVTGGYNSWTLDSNGTYTAIANGGTQPLATDGTVRQVVIGVTGFTPGATNKSVLTGADGNQMDTESFLASLHVISNGVIRDPNNNTIIDANKEIPFRVVTQQYGKGIVNYSNLTDATGTLYLGLDLSGPVPANGTATFDGYVGATGRTTAFFVNNSSAPANLATASAGVSGASFTVAWAQYASLELETEMGEVSFSLDEVTVSVEERKLRATWSPELAQDVSAFHNIDAEAELTAMLSEQVAAEIDREILRDLRKGAAWQLRWDYNGWRKSSSAANPYTQKDWNQELITRVNQVSAQIHKATLRGGANFIVVSSEISAIFDNLEYFHVSDASPEQDTYNMGIERIGSLSGRYQVYRDPYAPAYSIIIGHKGKSLLDTGYIYAPYVPMQLTPTMYNPFNFAPVKGIMTRYAKKLVNNRFYGHVRVDGVPTFNINELR
jgi:hypothetical protein